MLQTVTIKLIAPNKDESPAKCRLKIAKSTAGPECPTIALRGDKGSNQYRHRPHKKLRLIIKKD
jgi:hypothetical protein